MKKVMITTMLAILFLLGNAAIDGNQGKNEGKKSKKKEMVKGKEHVCSDACKDGKHALAHGEKGHTCTQECHKKK